MVHERQGETLTCDVVVVGAGFAGVYLLHKLRSLGFSVLAFEAGSDVGGTWYWNRYPGARCDVESLQYSYSFSDELQQEWNWSERFAAQPEILGYIQHVAERFDLKRDIRFNTRVVRAAFSDADLTWTLETDRGDRVTAPWCVMATGSLSASRIPEIAGLADFRGAVHHTGRWPKEGVDFGGQRVGVIGTGSSAVQAIPEIAKQAAMLTVFQRTPNFAVPARNGPLEPDYVQDWKRTYRKKRETARATRSAMLYDYGPHSAHAFTPQERREEFERRWERGGTNFLYAYSDIMRDEVANASAADFVREKIAELVWDPETAAALTPRNYPIGAKRICVDTGYYETFNRENVRLVDLRKDPIERITAAGVMTRSGEHPLDALVFATGFDAMTGALMAMDIRGSEGVSLREKWAAGPRTYLGLMTAGFPNLFMVTGPGSPSVLSNMVMAIEQHVDWIADCLRRLRDAGRARMEPSWAAEDVWVDHVNEVAEPTLYYKANSWYLGANVPGKPRVFMPYVGGFHAYVQRCNKVAANGYEGFVFERPASPSTPSAQGSRGATSPAG